MAKTRRIIEYRSYELPLHFPILLLTGERWHISDVPSKKLHFHNCLEIGICHTDEGWMEYDGEKHIFRAGDITFISRNIPHTTYSAPGKASLWSYLFVKPEEMLRGYYGESAPYASLYQEMLDNSRMILHRDEYPQIWSLVTQIMEETKEKPINYQFSVNGLMLALMMQILRIYRKQKQEISDREEGSGKVHDEAAQNALVIAPALDYIRDNYAQDFPMEVLADCCHLSQTHFRRVFHEIMQTSPLDFLNKTRIIQSCILLRMTEDSILTVSERVGFRSLSSFNRHFSAIMGMKPSEWRKSVSPTERVSILQYTGWIEAQIPE